MLLKSSLLFLFVFVILNLSTSIHSASIHECPANSRFNGCMSRCPTTCLNMANPPKNCVSQCTPGCECLDGFVKISKIPHAKCVKTFECNLYTKHHKLPYVAMRKMAAAETIQNSDTARPNEPTDSLH